MASMVGLGLHHKEEISVEKICETGIFKPRVKE